MRNRKEEKNEHPTMPKQFVIQTYSTTSSDYKWLPKLKQNCLIQQNYSDIIYLIHAKLQGNMNAHELYHTSYRALQAIKGFDPVGLNGLPGKHLSSAQIMKFRKWLK